MRLNTNNKLAVSLLQCTNDVEKTEEQVRPGDAGLLLVEL